MLTKTEALEIISNRLQKMSTQTDPFVVVEKNTIEKNFGWVFFYNSKTFLEKGIQSYRLAGNGPIIVNKDTGTIEFFGANKPPLEIIEEYERKLAEGNN